MNPSGIGTSEHPWSIHDQGGHSSEGEAGVNPEPFSRSGAGPQFPCAAWSAAHLGAGESGLGLGESDENLVDFPGRYHRQRFGRATAFFALGGSGAKISLSIGGSIARHCSPVKSGKASVPPHWCSSW